MTMEIAPHTLVVGKTDSGKSTAVRRLVLQFKAKGFKVLVLDPKMDPRFQADFITSDPAAFMREVRRHAGIKCVLVIDEGGTTVGAFNREMSIIATQYRELGFRAFFIVQRTAQMDKNIVLNCDNLFVFRCSGRDAKQLFDDFERAEIREAPAFGKGQYVFCPSVGPVKKGNIFDGLPRK